MNGGTTVSGGSTVSSATAQQSFKTQRRPYNTHTFMCMFIYLLYIKLYIYINVGKMYLCVHEYLFVCVCV